MNAKVTLLWCLAAVTVALPDRLPSAAGYEYQAPTNQLSYIPPTPAYKAPIPGYQAPAPAYQSPSQGKGMPFDFSYEVQDSYQGVDFGHNSNSDGNVVTGKYYVLLPDGRTQIVTYTADANGYQAEVVYEGEARYPEPQPYKPAPVPGYLAPSPPKPTGLYGTPSR